MNTILMIYVQNAFKEFILPSLDNADYSFTLHKEVFELEEDIEVSLEVVEQKWKFVQQSKYDIIKDNMIYFATALKNGDVLDFVVNGRKQASIIVWESVKSFQVYKKYNIFNIQEITIGKEAANIIQYDFYGLISRKHAKLSRKSGEIIIEDYSANGIFLNSRKISTGMTLKFGDFINIFGLHIVYLGNVIAIAAISDYIVNQELLHQYPIEKFIDERSTALHGKKELFHRAPRNIPKLYTEEIEIEAPPSMHTEKMQPMFLVIGSAFTMAIPMLLGCLCSVLGMGKGGNPFYIVSGLVTAVSSALIGVIWGYLNVKYTKQSIKEEEEKRFGMYGNYLIERSEFVRQKNEENAKLILEQYPSAQECTTYTKNSVVLWNRNFSHEDVLNVRLGLGNIPFQAAIKIPEKHFSMVEDFMLEKPQIIYDNYNMLQNVPVGTDLLKHNLLGIIGGKEKLGAIDIVCAMMTQIAASNSYTEVKMVLVYDEKNEQNRKNWEFAKWLPHLWSEDKKNRFFASNKEVASDIFFELANIARNRVDEQEESHSMSQLQQIPYYIIFIVNPELLEGELFAKYVYDTEQRVGMTTLLLVEKYEDLPNVCEDIIQNDASYQGVYNVSEGVKNKTAVQYDRVQVEDLEIFARQLAQIEVAEIQNGGEIPNVLDFFEMYGVSTLEEFNVLDRWRKNRTYESMRALIGKKAGGNDCFLDIHEKYHGPHGLIAGTTGSGKSETLQTYMLSLALNFSPNDVGFFVIDFKGGGMANLFSNLPHMLGQISNLSGNQVHRAMVSIKSENMRRQRIFNENGVNNINLYTRLLKNKEATIPVPHLFIVIDEFAELKREEPDFMKELISVAQVGRSLGVHLILATQKPSGTVDDNIWSNSKFRLCLRVQDKFDSNDMLHKPDAAYLTQSGRCYLQVGNDEIYELFQSGWSGAVYDESSSNQAAIATMITENGRTAIIGSRSKLKKKEEMKRAWLLKLCQCMIIAMQEVGVVFQEVIKTKKVMDDVINHTYLHLKKEEIEYQDSIYNRLRLEEFLKMWKENASTLQENVEYILQNAKENNKKLPEIKEKTQLDAVVEYLKVLAEENHYTNDIKLWMPVLPSHLYLHELKGYKEYEYDGKQWKKEEHWTLEAIIGLCDDPMNQKQIPLVLNFAENGHHAVCGMVVSGKSTFLQSLCYALIHRYSPKQLNLYMIDFSSQALGCFEEAPHVGGIMSEQDIDGIKKFFHMIDKILNERKKLLKGGTFSQYVQVHGDEIPAIIIMIDNIANFREKTAESYDDVLLMLSREGASYGIFLCMTASGIGMTEIPYKISENIRTFVTLEMSDKFKYGEMLNTMSFDVLPEKDVKGRGLVVVDSNVLEFQTALSMEAEDDYERVEKIESCCKHMKEMWTGTEARKVPEIPEKPIFTEFIALPDCQQMLQSEDRLPLGYLYADASVYGINLEKIYCYVISGRKRTGKTNVLKLFMQVVKQMNEEFCLFDFANNGKLNKVVSELECKVIKKDQEAFDYFKDLIPVFVERNKKKWSYIDEGLEEEEIYHKMKEYPPIFIFISDLTEFIKHIYEPEEGVGNMSGFLENIIEKGSLHHIYVFAAIDTDHVSEISSYKVYQDFVGYKTGVHLGGNIAAQRIFSFENISYMEQSKVSKAGEALVPSDEDESYGNSVIIPLVRG